MRAHIIALGTKEPQALRRIDRWSVVAFKSIARGTSIDEVLDLIGPSRSQGVKVVHLQLTTHRCLRHATIAASAAEGRPHGGAGLCRDRHLGRRRRSAREPGLSIEDGGPALVELGEETACIRGKTLLLREQS